MNLEQLISNAIYPINRMAGSEKYTFEYSENERGYWISIYYRGKRIFSQDQISKHSAEEKERFSNFVIEMMLPVAIIGIMERNEIWERKQKAKNENR